jgi:hypothetical protein
MLSSATIGEALAVTTAMHWVITFAELHWIKGSPDYQDFSTYNNQTLWEQISKSEQEHTKRFLILVPTVLLLLTLVTSGYSTNSMLVHIPMWVVLMLAKIPQMEGVRLFGINSMSTMDDRYEYDVPSRKVQ